MNVRQASIHDLERIQHLNKSLFEYETRFNTEYNLKWAHSEEGEQYFRKMIETGITLVAEVNSSVVGYIVVAVFHQSFRRENPIAELENMFIDTEYRRKGIGKKLVEEARKIAMERGAKRLKVEASMKNEQAINFYKECGFEDFDIILQMKLD